MSGLGWLLIAEALVVTAAVVGTGWLKREGDRSWREASPIVLITPDLALVAEAIRRATVEILTFQTAMTSVGAAAMKLTDELKRADR